MRSSRSCWSLVIAGLVAGCSGSDHPPTATTGGAAFTILWPTAGRLIPTATNSIGVVLTKGGSQLGSQVAARPDSGSQTTVTFRNLPPGQLQATATAYPNADGTGTAQATGSVSLTIVAGQTATATLTLTSTIDRLEISPATAAVEVRGTTQLNAEAKDAAGNVVLVGGSLTWESGNASLATVSGSGATATVTGVKGGSVEITVKDSESGQQAARSVTVAGVEVGASDFTPATGKGTPPGAGGNTALGPWSTRLLLATSPDGRSWTKLDRNLGDQTNVPSAIAWHDMVWVYFVAWNAADHPDWEHFLGVAVTSDPDLQTWTYKAVKLDGKRREQLLATDPTAIVPADDPYSVRLYYTYAPGGASQTQSETWSAVSTDGFNFTVEGQRYTASEGVADPQILWVGDHYEFFAGYWGWMDDHTIHHATSTDGLAFTAQPKWDPMAAVYLANGARLASGEYVWYGCDLDAGGGGTSGVRVYRFSAGSWAVEPAAVLPCTPSSNPLEGDGIIDVAVASWPPVGHVMAYMTPIP